MLARRAQLTLQVYRRYRIVNRERISDRRGTRVANDVGAALRHRSHDRGIHDVQKTKYRPTTTSGAPHCYPVVSLRG